MTLNIYRFELKAALKNSISWLAVLLVLLLVFMKGMYPLYVTGAKEIEPLFANFPPEFMAAFGLNVKEIFQYGGFYSFVSTYLVLCGAIMAVYLGVSTFAREKKVKTMDFLFTKPITREKIFLSKLLANLSVLVVTNLIFMTAAYFIYESSGDTTTTVNQVLFATSGLFFTQLVFLSMGILYAVFVKKVRSVASIAIAFGFGSFIISAVVNIIKEEKFNYIAPMQYFSPHFVFSQGSFEIKYVVMAIIVVVGCLVGAFIKYIKSDIQAV